MSKLPDTFKRITSFFVAAIIFPLEYGAMSAIGLIPKPSERISSPAFPKVVSGSRLLFNFMTPGRSLNFPPISIDSSGSVTIDEAASTDCA